MSADFLQLLSDRREILITGVDNVQIDKYCKSVPGPFSNHT